jgi:hypothetical protein
MAKPLNIEESIPFIDAKEIFWRSILAVLTVAIAPLSPAVRPHLPPYLQNLITEKALPAYIAVVLLLFILTAIHVFKTWRNRRRRVWGKVRSGTKAIWVAMIKGDDSEDTHRTNIIDSLREQLRENVDVLRAGIVIDTKISGNSVEDLTKAHQIVRDLFVKNGGDLVIWGKVLSSNPVVLRLNFSTPNVNAPPIRIELDKKLLLENFASALVAVCAALTIDPTTFFRQMEAANPNPLDYAWQLANQATQGLAWLAQGTLLNIGAVVSQALQISGNVAGQVGASSGAVLNEAAATGWKLLTQAAQSSSH